MIKVSSFEKKVYVKFRLIIEIQKTLSNLTNDNIDTIFKEISKKKEIIEKEIGNPIFAQCLNDVVNFRPKNIENIVDFIILIKEKTEKSKFRVFITNVVEIISTKEKLTSSDFFYIRSNDQRNRGDPFDGQSQKRGFQQGGSSKRGDPLTRKRGFNDDDDDD